MRTATGPNTRPGFVLVMGVCGVGKSTIGRAVACRLGSPFVEADDHHSESNIRALAAGQSLNDERRWPWLSDVCEAALRGSQKSPTPVVIACSALKRKYRDFIRTKLADVTLIHLTGAPSLIRARLETRDDHFASSLLLDSQIQDLEAPTPDEGVHEFSIVLPADDIVHTIIRLLQQTVATAGLSWKSGETK